jgi:hypothetical protein
VKRLAFVLGLVVAGVLVLYSGWRLQQWRQAEEDAHLRLPTASAPTAADEDDD